jgi:glycerol-3-phosphate acyltransferase PlsY
MFDVSSPTLAGLFLFGYLCGSVPFGLILTRLAGLGDIRAIGSGNIGATNVLRTGSKALTAATLALDVSKGAAAIVLSYLFLPENTLQTDMGLVTGLGAVVGHVFPVWLRFRGGKGVASALGVLLATVPLAGAAACAVWLAVALTTRYSSAAALAALALAPVVAVFVYGGLPALLCAAIAALVWVRHAANIHRLLTGQEPKIGRTAT